MVTRIAAVAVAMALTIAAQCLPPAGEPDHGPFEVFSPQSPHCPIILPGDASESERRAARLLQHTLAASSGFDRAAFPIAAEDRGPPRQAVYLGATRRSGGPGRPSDAAPRSSSVVGYSVRDGTLFMHRDLGLAPSEAARDWAGGNKLKTRIEHGHNFAAILRPEDFKRHPTIDPIRNSARSLPPPKSENWQPDLLNPVMVNLAAAAASRAFDASSHRTSFSVAHNDTDLFDESPATLAAVAPARFFRHRPDYPNLVFGFTNSVARTVAGGHSDRYLSAYAYYWAKTPLRFASRRTSCHF